MSNEKDHLSMRMQALFDSENPDALTLLAYLQRLLYQYQLSKVYGQKEILTEVYARAIKRIDAGEPIQSYPGWIRRTAFKVIREFKMEVDSVNFQEQTADPVLDKFQEHFPLVLGYDISALLAALMQLDAEDRNILRLRLINGLSWQEIGQCLVAVGEVQSNDHQLRRRAFRALTNLRKMYPVD
jgi:DNA-directed RNA polymerase specialized sigma24 family protein